MKTATPVAAIIDLGGDDRYNGTGLFGAGSALFGLAVLIDAAGNDTYRAAYAGQGAALGGAAWVEDRAGDDTYRGGVFCQGAAVAGLGALEDDAGRDVYEVGLAGQAYSGLRGAGWLIDRAGDDRYLAGNREPDWDRHPDRFLSLAQGFSIGLRPFAGGGCAALVDLAGNDTYVADVYGQGVSYWYSAGFLLDAAGNDTYRMFHYGQGSGIHLSLGLLADDAGDDSYTGSILAQGNAHDYAVGMLLDRGGNDTYTADTYSQGRALYNSFALLLDGGGNDVYFASQTNECQGLGHNGAQREYGGLALLVDEGGADRYSCGAANGTATLRPWYGTLCDIDPSLPAGRQAGAGLRAASHASEAAELRGSAHSNVGGAATERASHTVASHIEPEKAPVYETGHLQWPVLSIEQVLVLAQHPGNGPVDRAIRRDAGRELLWRGPAALEGLMRYAHLENNTIQLRTQEQVDSLSGEAAAPILALFLNDSHPRTRRLAAYYLGMHGRPEMAGRARASGPAEVEGGGWKVEGRGAKEGRAGASSPRRDGTAGAARQGCRRPTPDSAKAGDSILVRLRALLDDEEAAGAAIRALGKWRDRESVARIGEFLASVKEPRRVAAANALRDMGDPAAVPVLLAALGDPVFTVRHTAQRALIALGSPAEKAALKAWPTADPATRRHLLIVLAAGDSWAARRLVNAARHDPDESVRAEAAMLLQER